MVGRSVVVFNAESTALKSGRKPSHKYTGHSLIHFTKDITAVCLRRIREREKNEVEWTGKADIKRGESLSGRPEGGGGGTEGRWGGRRWMGGGERERERDTDRNRERDRDTETEMGRSVWLFACLIKLSNLFTTAQNHPRRRRNHHHHHHYHHHYHSSWHWASSTTTTTIRVSCHICFIFVKGFDLNTVVYSEIYINVGGFVEGGGGGGS